MPGAPTHEYAGNMHMHTRYSDGTVWHADIAAAAIDAGLDFVIVTDHNIWVDWSGRLGGKRKRARAAAGR